MKKTLFAGLLLATALTTGAQEKASLTLHFAHCGNSVYISGVEEKGYRMDVANETIETEWMLPEPRLVEIHFSNKALTKEVGHGVIPTKSGDFLYIAQPGQHYTQTGSLDSDYCDLYPSGDAENDILALYTRAYNPLQNEYCNLYTHPQGTKEETDKKADALGERIVAVKIDFLREHASSIAGIWLMNDMLLRHQIEPAECAKYFKKVSSKYKNHSCYFAVSTRLGGSKATAQGKPAPAIRTSRTLDGSQFDLKNLRGKYVLLDFWGTWCGSCIAGMPDMKAWAERHPDKVQLVGICCATGIKVEPTKAWLEKNHPEWNWIHLVNGTGEENYVLKYNVAGYPTKILIDPAGKVVKRFVGEQKGMYDELDKLIQ